MERHVKQWESDRDGVRLCVCGKARPQCNRCALWYETSKKTSTRIYGIALSHNAVNEEKTETLAVFIYTLREYMRVHRLASSYHKEK